MDVEKRKVLERAGWRFGDADEFLQITGEDLTGAKRSGTFLLRFVLLVITDPFCVFGGIAGAVAGMCIVLSWPLSGPNFTEAIYWGIGFGIFGVALTTLSIVVSRRERL
jgi:hypothetical protein